MKHEYTIITPAIAREMLKLNTSNRRLRPSRVESLLGALQRGEFLTTHQGIAFDVNSVLLDGQHRLHAISLMPDSFPGVLMSVTTGLPSGTFEVIDTELGIRSAADVLRVDIHTGVVSKFFATLLLTRQSTRPTPSQVKPFAQFVEPKVKEIVAFCPSASKMWSSGPVKAAVVMMMLRGHGDYALTVYRAMVLSKFDEMPPVAQALYRAHIAGSVRATGGRDLFVRCLKAFHPENANMRKIQINNRDAVIDEARKDVEFWMGFQKSEKKAPAVTRGAKSVSPDYRSGAPV